MSRFIRCLALMLAVVLSGEVYGQVNTAPTANFTVAPDTGLTATIFQYHAIDISDIQDSLWTLQLRWDWEGDGTWDTVYDTVTTNTHQYADTGAYTINLEVLDTGGLTYIATHNVVVQTPQSPTATFSVIPDTATVNTFFTGNASGVTDSYYNSTLLQVRWDWESDGTWDTNYSTTKTATHQYADTGRYIITMEVVNGAGLAAISQDTATVLPGVLSYVGAVTDGITGVTRAFIKISPDGRHAYVGNHEESRLLVYERNVETGLLTLLATYDASSVGGAKLQGVHHVIISPDGAHVYVMSDTKRS